MSFDASLLLKVDSSDVRKGVDELDKLTAAGGRAERAAGGLKGAAQSASAAAEKMAADMQASMTRLGDQMIGVGKKMSLGLTLPITAFGLASFNAAKDAAELQSAFNATFGKMAGDMNKWAEATGNALGRSTREIQEGANAFGLYFNQAAKTREEAAKMSQTFTVLAQDLASFHNTGVDEALTALRSGLSGETEPLRRFGVFLNEAAVAAQAAKMGLGDMSKELTDQEKIMARAAIIMEKTATAQGDVERTSDSAANQIRASKAAFEELQIVIGTKLLPAITPLISAVAGMLNWFVQLPQPVQNVALGMVALAAATGPVLIVVGSLMKLMAGVRVLTLFAAGLTGIGAASGVAATGATAAGIAVRALLGPIGLAITAATALYLAWKHWDEISAIVQRVYAAVKMWIADKLNGIWDGVKAKIRSVTNAFASMYDAVVGNSYVPDMVDEIGAQMRRLDSVMVQPVTKATSKAAEAFRDLQQQTLGLLSRLYPEAQKGNQLTSEIATLESAARAGIISIDQLRDALTRLYAELPSLDAGPAAETGSIFSGPDDAALEQQQLFLNGLRDTAIQAQQTGAILSEAFGSAGDAIGRLLVAQAEYNAVGRDGAATAAEVARAEVARNMTAIGAIKSLFKEKSTAYRAMEAIEKAYAAFQAAKTIAAIARDMLFTKASAANSAVRAAADGVAAVAKAIASMPFPLNIAAGAATAAALVAFGVKMFGGGGGGSSAGSAPTSAEDLQARQGTGTILGDANAKSQSIANSLEIMAKNSTKGINHSQEMVRTLRKIESGIGAMAASISREFASGGAFDTARMNIGTTSSSGFLGLFGGGSTTRSVYDQGITLNAATVQQIIERGIRGATYTIIQEVETSNGFLGIGGGTDTDYETTRGTLGSGVTRQAQLIITDVFHSIVQAANVFGLDVTQRLKEFRVVIGQISFAGLSGEEIRQQLSAVFSKVADDMAGFAIAGLAEFQQAGEGLYETLMRVAKEYLTIDAALKSIGMTFGAVGLSSVGARSALLELTGGLDEFVSQVNYFYDNFLTAAEKTDFMQGQVDAALAGVGLAGLSTIEQFKGVVQGLDLTTEAGREMFATLMQIAPAFHEVAAAAEQLAKAQANLQVQLLQARGDTEAATALQRSIALAALDPALQSLQQQVWEAQDASAAAADALRLANQESQIRVQILRAQGETEAALALERQIALNALNPALRALQTELWSLQDASAAAAEAARAAAEAVAQAIAAEAAEIAARQQLLIERMRLRGDEEAAIEAERLIALNNLNPVLRELQQEVWGLQDAAAAAAAALELQNQRYQLLAQVLYAQGDAETALAVERQLALEALNPELHGLQQELWGLQDAATAAAAAAELLNQRQQLQVQLLEAQGNTSGATALSRQLALETLDPALHDLQQQVWAAQDAAEAAALATQAADEAARAAAEAADRAAQILEQRNQLEVQLLEAQGRAAEALALQRRNELAAMSSSLHALQLQVWQAQDAAKARDDLTAAYGRESGELQSTIDRFRQFAGDLREFRDSLFAPSDSALSYRQALTKLMEVGGLAAGGDESALGSLKDVSQQFLSVAEENAGSLRDLQRSRAVVAQYLDQAIGGAEGQASIAEQQLAEMRSQVSLLVDIDERVQTVAEAIYALNAILASPVAVAGPSSPAANNERTEVLLHSILAATEQNAVSANEVARIFTRADRGGALAIQTDSDLPLDVSNGLDLA